MKKFKVCSLTFEVGSMTFIKTILITCFLFIADCGISQNIKSVKITEVEKLIAETKGPLIINMWATWCQPCVEELPYFLDEVNTYNASLKAGEDSILLVLVSLDFKNDYPKKIRDFAQKRKITAPIVWLDETNADYFCPKIDSAWSGAIPATLFVNNQTGYRKFYEEQLSREVLKKEIMAILKMN